MINEQVLLRKINEQLRDMPEARNRVKRLIYSMDWVDSIKPPDNLSVAASAKIYPYCPWCGQKLEGEDV